mgnify:CR=1 FL=1
MTEKRILILAHAEARKNAHKAIDEAQDGSKVTIGPPGRSLDQNAAQWPILEEISRHTQLCINGKMEWATKEDWKDALTAAYQNELRVALYDGKMILLGQRTSKFSKAKFSEWLDFLNAAAAQMGVKLEGHKPD